MDQDIVNKSKHAADLPSRLHHHAYVVENQERTRQFYEDVVGLPLLATWIEEGDYKDMKFSFSHTFYGLGDGSALAFFSFADPEVQAKFAAKQQDIFVHVALNVTEKALDSILERCKTAGFESFAHDHGYCKSIYVTDPDGLLVEFTADPPNVAAINAHQASTAHASLRAWMAGDRTPNNDIRPAGH